MDSGHNTETIHDLVKRLRAEILPLFKKFLLNNEIPFANDHLAACCNIQNCNSEECAIHSNESGLRCWHLEGTGCDRENHGNLLEKFNRCSTCEVFRHSMPTIVEEIGEHFNYMFSLLKKQDYYLLEKTRQIDHLKQKLDNALRQLEASNKRMQEMMITDNVTGLFKKHLVSDVLEEEIARCLRYNYPISIIMIGIDKLEDFIGNYGHLTAEDVLSFAGVLIKQNIRTFDRAFRYNYEEFLVILPETDPAMAYLAAERLRNSFGNNLFRVTRKQSTEEEKTTLTLSIGITAAFPYNTDHITSEELLGRADSAFSKARSRGGNVSVTTE